MPDTQVNTTTDTRGGINSAIVWVNDGYVVLWDDGANTGDIQSRRYDMSGAAVTPVTTVNTVTEGRQTNFSASQFFDGNGYVVVWSNQPLGPAADLEVRGRVYDVNGVAQGPEFNLTEDPNSSSIPLSVTGLSDGTFAMVWQTTTGSTTVRKLAVFSAAGVMLESTTLPSTPGPVLVQGLYSGLMVVQSNGTASPQSSGNVNVTIFGAYMEPDWPVVVNPSHPLGSSSLAASWPALEPTFGRRLHHLRVGLHRVRQRPFSLQSGQWKAA